MLKKNKDYVEFTLQYTSVDWARSKDCPEVCLKGYSDFSFPGVPIMDVVCNEFDHKVVVVSKRDFEALQTENERLKKKLEEFSPAPGYEEFLKTLYPEANEETIEKLIWTTKHIFGCGDLRHNLQTDLENYKRFSSIQAKSIRSWKEATGCDTPEEAEKKIENLKGSLRRSNSTMLKELDQEIDKWQKATGCSTPEEANKKLASYEGRLDSLKQSASIAIRHLNNIVFRDDKRTDWSYKIDHQ